MTKMTMTAVVEMEVMLIGRRIVIVWVEDQTMNTMRFQNCSHSTTRKPKPNSPTTACPARSSEGTTISSFLTTSLKGSWTNTGTWKKGHWTMRRSRERLGRTAK